MRWLHDRSAVQGLFRLRNGSDWLEDGISAFTPDGEPTVRVDADSDGRIVNSTVRGERRAHMRVTGEFDETWLKVHPSITVEGGRR